MKPYQTLAFIIAIASCSAVMAQDGSERPIQSAERFRQGQMEARAKEQAKKEAEQVAESNEEKPAPKAPSEKSDG